MIFTKIRLRSVVLFFSIMFLFTTVAFAGKSKPDPMKLLKRTKSRIEKLLGQKIAKKDKKALQAREKKIQKILEPFFDFEMLAKKTLDKHWKKRSTEQKKEFSFWLRALLQQAYIRGVQASAKKKDTVKPKISYEKQKIKGNKATILTVIRYLKKRKRRRRKRWKKIRVDWQLEWQKAQWKISDIITNDNSLMETYKEQFDKIITKKSYKELVRRIKKKVNQLRKKEGLEALKGPVVEKAAGTKPAKKKTAKKKKHK